MSFIGCIFDQKGQEYYANLYHNVCNNLKKGVLLLSCKSLNSIL